MTDMPEPTRPDATSTDPTPTDSYDQANFAGLVHRLAHIPPLPRFDVRLRPPDLTPWLTGNTGMRGVMQFDSGQAGPHVAITALMHGNEFAGAIVLDELLRQQFRPLRGKLSIGFLNLAAFDRFDPAQPTASRFVEEDMNRLWDQAVLDSSRQSVELNRARELRTLFDSVDILVDLHSMLWPSDPLILSGPTDKGRRFACTLGTPPMVVSDQGHNSGPRLIDYRMFANPDDSRVACLIEAGPHWEPITVDTARIAVRALLRGAGMAETAPLPGPVPRQHCAEVTRVVTASTASFSFIQSFRGGEVIRDRNTLIGHDGAQEIRTPYDNCLLVMPSLRPSRGHTAVRLARLLPDAA
ncbi:MAG: succinylglutamate desuccinylase [Janthinobacterium lividum]